MDSWIALVWLLSIISVLGFFTVFTIAIAKVMRGVPIIDLGEFLRIWMYRLPPVFVVALLIELALRLIGVGRDADEPKKSNKPSPGES